MMFKSQTVTLASFSIALLLSAGTTQAEPSLETRAPDESKELDRDENGTPDAYWEQYTLGNGVTIDTHERLEESSGKLRGRMTFIRFKDKEIWSESYLPSLRERSATASRQSPFDISTISHAKSGKATVILIDDKASPVAVLVREKGGRLSPVTDEELERLQKLGKAVSEFAQGILDNPEELEDSKVKASEHLRRLDDAVSEYTEGDSEHTNGPTESESETK